MNFWKWMLVLALASVVANGFIAHAKSCSVIGWVILGLMFNPIPLVALLFLPLPCDSHPIIGTCAFGPDPPHES